LTKRGVAISPDAVRAQMEHAGTTPGHDENAAATKWGQVENTTMGPGRNWAVARL